MERKSPCPLSPATIGRRAASGFTMIELMVVVVIIAILAGLLLPVISMVRRKQARVATQQAMNQVTQAVVQYLAVYGRLGPAEEGGASFIAAPARYLASKDPSRPEEGAFLEMSAVLKLAKGPAGAYQPARLPDGEHICDHFGGYPANPLIWRVVNWPDAGADRYSATIEVEVRSQAGTPSDPSDDLVMLLITRRDPARPDMVPGAFHLLTP